MTFEAEWTRCAPWLQAALDRAGEGYTLADALREVTAHRATFWPGPDAALITERWNGPYGSEANIWLAGGSLKGLLAIEPILARTLTEAGFAAISIIGRKGWARVLKPLGWSLTGDELRKVLA